MTGYSLKGTIGFILILILILAAVVSGDFSGAWYLIISLIGGMILYHVGRYLVRIATGWDPHEGTTRSERKIVNARKKKLGQQKKKKSSEGNIGQTVEEFAKNLSRVIFNNVSNRHSDELYEKILSLIVSDQKIGSLKRTEILILEMWCHLQQFKLQDDDPKNGQIFLDAINEQLLNRFTASEDQESRINFQSLIQYRFTKYTHIYNIESNSASDSGAFTNFGISQKEFSVGMEFLEAFLGQPLRNVSDKKEKARMGRAMAASGLVVKANMQIASEVIKGSHYQKVPT